MKFIVRYELACLDFEECEVEVEAESAFEADVKVRDTSGPLDKVAGVGTSRSVERRPRRQHSRRVMSIKEKV